MIYYLERIMIVFGRFRKDKMKRKVKKWGHGCVLKKWIFVGESILGISSSVDTLMS